MTRWIVVFCLCGVSATAHAEDTEVIVASPVVPRFDEGSHIEPDARALRYEFAGRWRASVGGELALLGVTGEEGALALCLGGVLALDNEDDRAPVPYQMLRAVIGVGGRAATPWLHLAPAHHGRVSARLEFAHESDHPSGTSDIEARLRPLGLDDFSSFEYIRFDAQYEHRYERLWLSATGTIRVFTPPINPAAGREQRVAGAVELRARLHIHGALSAYTAFYLEGIAHDFDGSRVSLVVPDVLRTVRAELGVSLASGDVGRLDLYGGLFEGDGRGIDFVQRYAATGLVGLRGTL